MNPNLCVAPGKLFGILQVKSDDSFPSYPDMNNQTRAVEDRDLMLHQLTLHPGMTKMRLQNRLGIKVTDKRKNKDQSL